MPIRFCAGCGVSLAPAARFCGRCGRPAPHRPDAVSVAAERRRDRRHAAAILIVLTGTLLALGIGAAVGGFADSLAAALVAGSGAQVAVGLVACGVLVADRQSGGVLRATLGTAPSAGDVAIAPTVGLAALTVAFGWVALLQHAAGAEVAAEPFTPAVAWLTVTLVPLVEEWLSRGVAWHAAEPLAGPAAAVWITAALFALMHGLNGGFVLELPHRFAGGLALGWLRLRSGSLVPPMIAHATWNLGAVLID